MSFSHTPKVGLCDLLPVCVHAFKPHYGATDTEQLPISLYCYLGSFPVSFTMDVNSSLTQL
jgi:hypothetical protein